MNILERINKQRRSFRNSYLPVRELEIMVLACLSYFLHIKERPENDTLIESRAYAGVKSHAILIHNVKAVLLRGAEDFQDPLRA